MRIESRHPAFAELRSRLDSVLDKTSEHPAQFIIICQVFQKVSETPMLFRIPFGYNLPVIMTVGLSDHLLGILAEDWPQFLRILDSWQDPRSSGCSRSSIIGSVRADAPHIFDRQRPQFLRNFPDPQHRDADGLFHVRLPFLPETYSAPHRSNREAPVLPDPALYLPCQIKRLFIRLNRIRHIGIAFINARLLHLSV